MRLYNCEHLIFCGSRLTGSQLRAKLAEDLAHRAKDETVDAEPRDGCWWVAANEWNYKFQFGYGEGQPKSFIDLEFGNQS